MLLTPTDKDIFEEFPILKKTKAFAKLSSGEMKALIYIVDITYPNPYRRRENDERRSYVLEQLGVKISNGKNFNIACTEYRQNVFPQEWDSLVALDTFIKQTNDLLSKTGKDTKDMALCLQISKEKINLSNQRNDLLKLIGCEYEVIEKEAEKTIEDKRSLLEKFVMKQADELSAVG